MSLEYLVKYHAENHYDSAVKKAVWQFLIIPETNDNQEVVFNYFNNSLHVPVQSSINAYGFNVFRVQPGVPFRDIRFDASFKVFKKEVNPFDFIPASTPLKDQEEIQSIAFKADFEPFLRKTRFTSLPDASGELFEFDPDRSIFNNLLGLNHWVYLHLHFQPGVTHVDTTLDEIIHSRKGVCQDFTHLFCAIARRYHIPVRYVSGYLHQGSGYFGDSQMHAWAEAYLPETGWVGFDPTNDILAGTTHIKVAHGKDYADCSPLKGVIYGTGDHHTSHKVMVSSQ